MSQNDSNEIRNIAEHLLSNTHSRSMSHQGSVSSYMGPADLLRARNHINLITEEFLAGYMQDGRMSVVRRFFCLFVTFDLFFVSLLWLICIVINGDNIYVAFQKQVVHYSVYTSLFDVVAAAICRFIILIFFYALLYINHWFVIAFSTTGSCVFLISKVFLFEWVNSKDQVFQVILILTSFVLAWGEAWFLDCRVIPQERHARSLFSTSFAAPDRSPLMASFLASQTNVIVNNAPESVANFYSPLDTVHNSDDEDDQDEDYHQMALDCVRKAYELFEYTEWKVEKVNSKGDTIQSAQREKIGKVFKLTARIKYPAKALLDELFYKIEAVPKWNPTILESKIVRKINSYTDITYQASASGGGGIIKSRDFVNLRCWRLFRNGKMINNSDELESSDDSTASSNQASVSTLSDVDSSTPLPGSVSSNRSKFPAEQRTPTAYETLSKSLGAQGFGDNGNVNYDLLKFTEPPPLEDTFEDASDQLQEQPKQTIEPAAAAATFGKVNTKKNKVWLTAAFSVDYAKVPASNKYTRGENIVTAFALREIAGKKDACIFEWILCLDLKGYIPRYVLDAAYSSFMSDYMTYLRKYVEELRQQRKCAARS